MWSNAGLETPCRTPLLLNLRQPPADLLRRRLKRPRLPRRKNQHLRRLRRRRRLRCNNLRRRGAQGRWKLGSLRMMFPRKLVARPTPSFGSTYLRRSITSLERKATGLQNAAHICARKKLSLARTGRQRLKSIHDQLTDMRDAPKFPNAKNPKRCVALRL